MNPALMGRTPSSLGSTVKNQLPLDITYEAIHNLTSNGWENAGNNAFVDGKVGGKLVINNIDNILGQVVDAPTNINIALANVTPQATDNNNTTT